MTTKRELLRQLAKGEGILGKADDDEELFILRSRDMFAPMVVRFWAMLFDWMISDKQNRKYREAMRCAAAMEKYALTNGGARLPD